MAELERPGLRQTWRYHGLARLSSIRVQLSGLARPGFRLEDTTVLAVHLEGAGPLRGHGKLPRWGMRRVYWSRQAECRQPAKTLLKLANELHAQDLHCKRCHPSVPSSHASHLAQVNQAFPKGQQSNVSFKWRDYSPVVFQHLREIFGLESRDYLLSLAGDRCSAEPDQDWTNQSWRTGGKNAPQCSPMMSQVPHGCTLLSPGRRLVLSWLQPLH